MQGTARSNGVFGSSGSPSGHEDPAPRKKRGGKASAARSAAGGRSFGGSTGKSAGKASGKAEKKLGPAECRAKMLQLLAMRDYSVHAMTEKLSKAGFSEKDVKAAVAMAVKTRLMDDNRYGLAYISYKKEAGWGRQKIEQELGKQGVDYASLPGYTDELFDEDDELERARRCLASHHTSSKDPRAAHYRYLLSKGFSPAVCSRALRSL